MTFDTVEGDATEIQAGAGQAAQPELDSILDSMDAEAGQDATEGGAPSAEETASSLDEITAILFTAGHILAMKYPSLRDVFTKQKCHSVAETINPLFEYYGWKLNMGVFGLWLTALTGVVMLAMEVKIAIAHDLAEALKQAADEHEQSAV